MKKDLEPQVGLHVGLADERNDVAAGELLDGASSAVQVLPARQRPSPVHYLRGVTVGRR